jgi:hypothetical protein
MALSNQSYYQRFFSPRQVNFLKISHRILPNPSIPEDDLPNVPAKRKKDSIQAEE